MSQHKKRNVITLYIRRNPWDEPIRYDEILQSLEYIYRKPSKIPKFIAAASRKGVLAEGSVIAMQITTPNGETLETNLKITASDLELVQQLKKMR